MVRFSISALLLLSVSAWADDGMEFFEKKVRPLLAEHCLECHGAEKHKGGLRLDSRAGWEKGGDTGPALLPGKPEQSLLSKAVSYTDRDLKMPPRQRLPEAATAILNEWIARGAPDPRTVSEAGKTATGPAATAATHWAYQPIKKPATPAVKDASWPRNAIDHFVLAKLEQQSLKPQPDAAKDVLARRLSYDLTGLPVSENQGEITPAALLCTPAFAERWGQHWLDAARFSESSGGGRTLPFKDAWRYRDYVIQSIGDDVPLDQFVTEQIAGDLLPYESAAQHRRQITATAFLALGPNNYEEQDKAALRMDIVDEQLDVIGKSLLGMSIGCARCHDHKFDPIPTRDYYALAGILRSTKMIRDVKENVAHWIDTPLPLDGNEEAAMQKKEAHLAQLDKDLARAKAEVKKLSPKVEPKDGKTRPLALDEVPGIVVDDAQAKQVGMWKLSKRYPTYIGEGYLHDENMNKGQCTLTFVPKIERSGRYEVWFSYTVAAPRANNVPVTVFHADGEEQVKVDETIAPTINGRFISLGQYRFEAGGHGFVLVSNDGTKSFVTADAVAFVPVDQVAKLQEDEQSKDTLKSPALAKATKQLHEVEAEIKKLKAAGPKRPEAMSVVDHEELGDTYIHIRGNLRNVGPTVPRGFMESCFHGAVPAIPQDQSGRVQLARWLTSRDNTLTARVLANRVWMNLFGEGLVRSPDNFGVTGEAPSHPELLDHLASYLMDNGWSLKKLVAYIVDSRSYRMASTGTNAHDPDNRLLWRQNRKRLDANAIRDTILATAGTLDRKFLGPTIGSETTVTDACDSKVLNVEYNYVFTDSRRSVYTPAFRNRRLELFDVFDFNSNNIAIARRNTSTVAPQALYMMNHAFVIEQSRKAAQRLLGNAALRDDASRLNHAYHSTLGRAPDARETRLAGDFVAVSPGESNPQEHTQESWALLMQTLFACADFRYLD